MDDCYRAVPLFRRAVHHDRGAPPPGRSAWRLALIIAVIGTAILVPAPIGTAADPGTHDRVVSADPSDTTPHVLDGKVTSILPMGERVYVGGTFTKVREAGAGTTVRRHGGLFAFVPSTGAIDERFRADFDVDPGSGAGVEALAAGPDSASVFVAGSFGSLNGEGTGTKLVRVDAETGARDHGFQVAVKSRVKDLAVSGTRLFLAGAFTEVDGVARERLAAVDTVTGAVDPGVDIAFTAPRRGKVARVEAIAVSPDGRTIVAGGNFMKAAGQDRAQVAMLELGGGAVQLADWQTDRFGAVCSQSAFQTHIRDIAMSPDGAWFVIVTTGGYDKRALCDSASRWETAARGSGLQPTWWDRSGGDSFTSVAVTATAVYVGGHMRWLNNNFPKGTSGDARPGPGAVPRAGIAALDPANGLPLGWDPGRERGEGTWAMVPTADGLWVGSDTEAIGGEYHGRLAFFPLAGGYEPATGGAPPLPGELWTIDTDGNLSHRWYDGQRAGAARSGPQSATWADVRGAFTAAGRLYTGREDGRLTVQPVGQGRFGTATEVDLRGLSSRSFPVRKLTGAFYDAGRLYYTVAGDPRLYYRWFSPDADIVGHDVFVAAGEGDRFDFSTVSGMVLASDRLAYASDGVLRSVRFEDGAPVPGTETVVTGPSPGDWTSRGMFVLSASSSPSRSSPP